MERMAEVVQEIPCRDTDPLPGEDDLDSNRDSPVAFTINFGFDQSDEREKAKKLERFALRSSLRKPKSPRNQPNSPTEGKSTSLEAMRNPSSTSPQHSKSSQHAKLTRDRSFVREKSNISSGRAKSAKSVINSLKSPPPGVSKLATHSTQLSTHSEQMATLQSRKTTTINGYNRRLTTTLSPEESKMFSHFEKERTKKSLEIVEYNYEDDFEVPSSPPSETGTYTVGKDEEEKAAKKEEKARSVLECMVGGPEARNAYVEDWAARHAPREESSLQSPSSLPSPPSLPSPQDSSYSPLGTRSSLSKSRRRLPATPGHQPTGPVSPENLNFSLESQSPSPNQDSDDGESYMKHTQHLVDIMEARIQRCSGSVGSLINRSKVSRTTSSSSTANTSTLHSANSATRKTSATRTLSNLEVGRELEDAKEAWNRRKNYDPLAASGRKKEVVKEVTNKEVTRKASSSSLISPREVKSRVNSIRDSAPKSAGSRLESFKSGSESSGYMSRSDGGRFSMRGSNGFKAGVTRSSVRVPSTKPQSKLLTNCSGSDLKNSSSSRSSSSLTSREAEFQAWKRRKNYDPLKSANSRKSSNSKSAYSPSPTQLTQPAQHKRIQDMTQSLVCGESSDDGAPMMRSASFHYENARTRALTSEDESAEDYGSGSESHQVENGGRHYYLDEDELILPIYPSSSQRSIYNHKSISPKLSPSRSRSKLEALDNLVISTIYSVSSKLCIQTSNMIKRAGQSFPPADEDQATTVETILYLLEEVDLPSSPAKKTSRELSGTLRNLKKVEQAVELLNKLMDNDDSEAS